MNHSTVAAWMIALVMPSCAALQKIGPIAQDIMILIQDAAQLLGALENTSRAYFAAYPNPKNEVRVNDKFALAHAALDHSIRAAKEGSQSFDEFKQVYGDLLAELIHAGVITSTSERDMSLPKPLAVSP